uniref:hypothetical protein n=1 Tax=Agathobacter sp. TaxID=2021311 RepID=UPI0040574147
MSQIMKAFMGIFLILFLMASSASVLGAFLQVLKAQDMHAMVVDELENSDYSQPVLQESFTIAEKSGYDLDITLYQENHETYLCSEKGQIPQNTKDAEMAKVTLTFFFQIPFFAINQGYSISGYAR